MNKRPLVLALVVVLGGLMSGCTPPEPAPTGQALLADAQATYDGYRPLSLDLMRALHDGEWSVGLGGYGATPSSCDYSGSNDGYRFNLSRQTRYDDSVNRMERAEAAVAVLRDAGLDVLGGLSSPGGRGSISVRGGGFELIHVNLDPSGGTSISIETACRPGNVAELLDLQIENHADRRSMREAAYMFYPATESPDDEPLFLIPADMPVHPDHRDEITDLDGDGFADDPNATPTTSP